MRPTTIVGLTLITFGAPLSAQTLASRITAQRDGEVRLAFTAREGICGDGRTFIRDRDHDSYTSFDDGNNRWRGHGWRERVCEDGPVRVSIKLSDGRIRRVRAYVGGDWSYQKPSTGPVTDLGAVAAPAAAKAMLELARRSDLGEGEDLVFPTTLADSTVIWKDLLALAKDQSAGRPARKQAVFWVSQAAGDKAAEGLGEIVDDNDEDREVREQAVFALSQLPREEGVPILIKAARSNRDPSVRRKAMFWLGQSEDPRALSLFEEILTKP